MRHLARLLAVATLGLSFAATGQPAASNPSPAAPAQLQPGEKVAPFVPSASRVVDEMLELANVGPGDYLIDLGSGDGQIVHAAAARGALGHGIERESELIERSRTTARDKGVGDQTAFLQEDIFTTDISRATVVTLYLMPAANERLRPLLLERLRPGTRVVSNTFNMQEWEADEYEVGSAGSGIYLWVIPAKVAGEWRFQLRGQPWSLTLSQEFQAITPELKLGDQRLQVHKATLRGRNLQLIARAGDVRYTLHGRVNGDRVEGLVQIGDAKGDRVEHWNANRATRQ